jgi:hypothetical protein
MQGKCDDRDQNEGKAVEEENVIQLQGDRFAHHHDEEFFLPSAGNRAKKAGDWMGMRLIELI